MTLLLKVYRLFLQGDIRFFLFEKLSLYRGEIEIMIVRALYRSRFEIGSNYKVWGKIRFFFHGKGKVVIGKDFHCVTARRRSFITLFTSCHLTIIDEGMIILGNHVGLNGTTITARSKVSIGDNTMIGPNTIIIDHDGHVAWPLEDRWIKQGPIKEIIIENDVWIGMNCIILKGVTIGSGAIIAAGSIVINDVEPNSIYAGNPAKKIKELDENISEQK